MLTYGSLLCTTLWMAEPVAPPTVPPQDESEEVAAEPQGGAAVSPVELIPRLELRQSFRAQANGNSVSDTSTEVDIEFLQRVLLRYEGTHRILSSAGTQTSGLADTRVLAIAMLVARPTL